MVKDSKIKIINIIAGAKFGGAELFFERLSRSFEQEDSIHQKIIMKSDSQRFNNLSKEINDIEQIRFFSKFNPLYSFRIEQIIKSFNPDIIISWMNRASSLLPKLRFNQEKYVGRLGGYYKIKNYIRCDFLITNTPHLKQYVINQGWDKNKVEFIPNFVSYNMPKVSKLNEENTLVCMGRFHENKAIDIIIKAMPFLPVFKLFIVGEGPLKNFYKSLINKLNLNDRVKIFNWSQNISEYLNSCSILICPSRHEPFGNIVIEGWAHKIPIVVSNTGGPGKIIKHKINGMKFQKDDVFDLVSKINELNTNIKLKKKIIVNGFDCYKKNYSERVIVSRYLSFFKKIKKKCVV